MCSILFFVFDVTSSNWITIWFCYLSPPSPPKCEIICTNSFAPKTITSGAFLIFLLRTFLSKLANVFFELTVIWKPLPFEAVIQQRRLKFFHYSGFFHTTSFSVSEVTESQNFLYMSYHNSSSNSCSRKWLPFFLIPINEIVVLQCRVCVHLNRNNFLIYLLNSPNTTKIL